MSKTTPAASDASGAADASAGDHSHAGEEEQP